MYRLRTTFASLAVFLGFGFALAGCATEPTDAENQRLDTNTGTTVTLMPKPVELVIEKSKGPKTDPFAYMAPFETNRMGSHELYLWVSAPQVAGALDVPQVYCGDAPIALEKYEGTLKEMGLSGGPYKMPAPWSTQWYFKLSGEVLDCFAETPRIRVITHAADDPEPATYAADGAALSGLGSFVSRVRT
ncbi:MAG: hypothetical protein WDO56_34630 [Gammaproteobacteria bacterium]